MDSQSFPTDAKIDDSYSNEHLDSLQVVIAAEPAVRIGQSYFGGQLHKLRHPRS
jgi:hypothetical protein